MLRDVEVSCKVDSGDGKDSLIKLLKCLESVGNGGHSFSIVVDPDAGDKKEIIDWDGDGSAYITDIKVK